MKVLILSCNTGGGHNAAAQAIAEASVSMVTVQKCWIICLLPEKEYRNWSGMVM